MATKPKETAYKSAYSSMIDDLENKAVNREAFSYDPATDAAYQSYARQYTRLGNEAAKDTLADVAANTGGLASSYATTAAMQARSQYNQALTDKIPALMEAAYAKYRDEYNDTLAGISTLQGVDDSLYNRFATDRDYRRNAYESDRDYERAVFESNRAYNRDKFVTDRDYNRGVFESNRDYNRAKLESDREYNQQVREFNESVRQFEKNYDLDKNSTEFEQMLNTWTTLGYANKKVAKYFGVKEGTKTNEASYQAAQLALQRSAANGSSGRGGGRGRSGRSYGRRGGSSSYQGYEDQYGKFVEMPTEGIYEESPYNQALHIASEKFNNGASDEQILNFINSFKGLSKAETNEIKRALGLETDKNYKPKDEPAHNPYTGIIKAGYY
jgi:hypothetical protein